MEHLKSNEKEQSAADAMTRLHNLASEHPDPEKDKIAKKLLEQWEKAQEEGNSDEVIRLIGEIDKLYEPKAEKEETEKETPDEYIETSGTSLEQKLNLKEQYEKQKEILENTGILKTLKSGEKGIVGIGKKEYPFPGYEEIKKRVNANKEMLETKSAQGFTKLLITPFALPLSALRKKLGEAIFKHHRAGKLFATKKDQNDANEKLVSLDLDENQPIRTWDGYKNEPIVYEPERFNKTNHNGKTKEEVIKTGAWQISFMEDLPNLPAEGKGKSINGRKQLEAGKNAIKYLKLLQGPQYQNEQGITPEDWATYFLTHLEETNQVIDDYSGNGKISCNLGAFFPESSVVPCGFWRRVGRQVLAGGFDAGDPDTDGGVRSRVRI
jgi:hypothetical protein